MDINDFDEVCGGVDFMVDLKRLAASVVVAAQDAKLPDKKPRAKAQATVAAYRDFMSYLVGRSPLEILQTRMDLREQLNGFGEADLETKILDQMLKAEKKASAEQPGIETGPDGSARFADKPPAVGHVAASGEPVAAVLSTAALDAYKATLRSETALMLDRYVLRDVAFKVVGVGSVGTFCAIGLMQTADGEQIVLQLKQARDPVILGLASGAPPASHAGKRVVDGQRTMQASSDIFLGYTQDDAGRMFYMRRLKNRRLGSIGQLIEGKALEAYATLCGRTLARAHARPGDPAMISGYLGGSDAIDEALATFAMSYASQTVLDHARLVASSLVPQAATPARNAA